MTFRTGLSQIEQRVGCRIGILSFHAHIVGPPLIADLVREAFPPSPAWSLTREPKPSLALAIEPILDEGLWQIVEGDCLLSTVASLPELSQLIAWVINTRAVEQLGTNHLLFHAGAVAIGRSGIILPGRSGSGKSTLTAALIARGFTYYSDEVAVIAPDCGSLLPFPKALKIEPASLPVLAGDYPELDDAVDRPACRESHPTYLRPPDSAWPLSPATPAYVIFPRYLAGATTSMESISRAEGFARLLDHAFSTGNHAAEGVHQIVRLLQGCECYDLTMGDLDDAVSKIALLAS